MVYLYLANSLLLSITILNMEYNPQQVQDSLNQVYDIIDANEINYGETSESIALRAALDLVHSYLFNK